MRVLEDNDTIAWQKFIKYRNDKWDLQYRKRKEREQKAYKKYKRRRHWLNKYKESQGCHVCGYKTNALALAFENLDRKIANNYIKWKPNKLIEFIRKKKVICKNCINIKVKKKCYSTNPER